MTWAAASWKKGGRTITGEWYYNWGHDKFVIVLNEKNEITGERISVSVSGDSPEFNGWKLVKHENHDHRE